VFGIGPGADYEVNYDDFGLVMFKNGKEPLGSLDVKILETTGSFPVKYRRAR